MRSQLNKLKYITKIVLINVALTLILLEISVRLYDYARPKNSFETQSHQWLVPNRTWGVWHQINSQVVHQKECFTAKYTSNSQGMRDKVRSFTSKQFRIAALGDSMVEGYSVNDRDTFTRIMEDEIFQAEVEFLNFGTSGNFGTIQQWIIYDEFASKFKPNIVILFFFNANDLVDNSYDIQKSRRWSNYWNRPFLREEASGEWQLYYHDFGAPKIRKNVKKSNCSPSKPCTLFYLKKAVANVLNWGALRDIFKHPPDLLYGRSWLSTQEALRRLNKRVTDDGAKLLIVDLPHPAQIVPKYYKKLYRTEDFDPLAPNKILRQIASKLGIRYFAPLDKFIYYRDKNDIQAPYFSHTCDSHWTADGHRVAASIFADYLISSRLIPAQYLPREQQQ